MIGTAKKNARTDSNTDRVVNRIAEGTSFNGTLNSENNVRVDGVFEGDLITKERLVIGVTGRVKGNISCAHCETEGTMEGQITVQDLFVLKATARVHGEIEYGQLSVENGAQATGSLHLASKVKDLHKENILRKKEQVLVKQPEAV